MVFIFGALMFFTSSFRIYPSRYLKPKVHNVVPVEVLNFLLKFFKIIFSYLAFECLVLLVVVLLGKMADLVVVVVS